MAAKTEQNGLELYTIGSSSGKTRASFVPQQGGAGCSLIMPHAGKEREILYLHDNFWQPGLCDLGGGLPFLFPVCARIERMGQQGCYLYDGNIYHLPIHGFAPYASWEVVDGSKDDSLTMQLTANSETMALYPFKFSVKLHYKICEGALTCEQTYCNNDDKLMPYYAGFHPYLLTPEAGKGKDEVMLNFNPRRLLRYNDHLTDVIGEQKPFALPVSITDAKVNEQLFEVAHDNTSCLTFPDKFKLFMRAGGMRNVNLFPYLQLYTMAKKPFICVEPWMAVPNSLNTVLGARILRPGRSEKAIFELSCTCPKGECCIV